MDNANLKKEFRVRRCDDAQDAAAIYRLTREQAVYERSLDEMKTTEQDFLRDGFERNPPLFYAALAECFDSRESKWNSVGFAMFFLSYSSWTGRTLYLEEIFVEEQHRRNGLGSRLMQHVVDAAIEWDCGRLQWVVLDWNVNSIRFYEDAGAKLLPEWKLMRFDRDGLRKYVTRVQNSKDETK